MTTATLPAPLVLIVEDDPRSRELMAEAFTDAECQVIAVESPEDAVWEIRSSPGIDLLITDVRLRADDDDDDISGARLGEYLKRAHPEIPVAVYSTKFLEGELDRRLSESAETRFDLVLARCGPLWWEEEDALDGCIQLARQFRDRRYDAAAAGHESKKPASRIEVMREFLVGQAQDIASNEMLRGSGYSLRLLDVRHQEFRGPLAVWVLEHGDRTSAELYQNPRVHAVGRNLNETLERLAILLHEKLGTVAAGGTLPVPDPDSIPWLMLQHADDWDRMASDIESRD